MIHKVFAVYDSKAEAYLPPFFVQNQAVALRSFASAAQDADHQFHKFGADYTLFELGEYDDSTGVITTHKAQINHGTALLALQATTPKGGE